MYWKPKLVSESFACLLLVPGVGPENVSSMKVNQTTFNISWASITREKSYSKVIVYEVKRDFKGLRTRRSTVSSRSVNSTGTLTFVVLHGLQKCAQYNVSVRAYTVAGPGPYSPSIILETSSKYNL